MQGGPGASSFAGIFTESGPLRINRNGTGPDDFEITKTDNSWLSIPRVNLLFLDNPVGAGFSFGNSYVTSLDEVSSEFQSFLSSFYALYPEFTNSDLYFTGESYAGKYLSKISHDILELNKKAEKKIPLKALLISDPLVAPATQRPNMYLLGRNQNMLDENNMRQVSALI